MKELELFDLNTTQNVLQTSVQLTFLKVLRYYLWHYFLDYILNLFTLNLQ